MIGGGGGRHITSKEKFNGSVQFQGHNSLQQAVLLLFMIQNGLKLIGEGGRDKKLIHES